MLCSSLEPIRMWLGAVCFSLRPSFPMEGLTGAPTNSEAPPEFNINLSYLNKFK